MTSTNGSALFAGITSGLTSTYSILANASGGKITQASILAAQSNSTYAATINPTFASYIQSNFTSLDTDHDGVLSAAELSTLTNRMMSTGLTSTQLSQLGTATGMSSNELEQVLEHFTKIDTNGDGKVTANEIASYKLTSAMNEKKTEFANRAAANQSVFYGDNDSSSTDSSSMLSFQNWNNGNGSSTTTGTT